MTRHKKRHSIHKLVNYIDMSQYEPLYPTYYGISKLNEEKMVQGLECIKVLIYLSSKLKSGYGKYTYHVNNIISSLCLCSASFCNSFK